ncbi:MAG: Hsp70 family protein [Myxococcota bacterium]|nr:Hsp70 family protein [Myxococcota bacterium]
MNPGSAMSEDGAPNRSQWTVGIDLGTTHCALAFGQSDAEDALSTMGIPQVVAAGQTETKALLPSFLYLPHDHEFGEGGLGLPWQSQMPYAVGHFARAHGAKLPDRLVTSAKSWLCHDGVDRTSALLPWGGREDVDKMSPLDASTAYLKHLASAWQHQNPSAGPLKDQFVVLTVPASFDAVARDLTVQAARSAGLERPVLLEEPQAALYAWLDEQGDGWRKHLQEGDVVLVCDIGGGTTDFSLIAIEQDGGDLALRRIAVGDHILLGGDNMDLALAFSVRQQLAKERGVKLDGWQLQALTQSCRAAKEALLTDPNLASFPLVVPSRGSKLIGGTIRTELRREQVTALLVEGFFPQCALTDRPRQARRTGFAEMGLPYAADAGVTRHLAHFLSRQSGQNVDNHSAFTPTAVLFNGGVLKADILRQRTVEVIDQWLTALGRPAVRVLNAASFDVSVARGAAYFGRVRQGAGIRIRGGLARSYYVGVEQAMPAVPGFEPPMMAVCLAPFGMEEGTHSELTEHDLGLYVGEPAQFRFFASSVRQDDAPGAILEDWDDDELEELPPIETELAVGDGAHPGQRIGVNLRCDVTEIGTLMLACVESGGQRSWTLEFNVRLTQDEAD